MKIIIISILLLITSISGCTNFNRFSIQAPSCASLCTQNYNSCLPNCHDNCQNCTAKAQIHAEENYQYYLHEQYVQGKPVSRDLQSYRDPLQCRKVTCNCAADYKNCRQGCSN